MNPISFTIIGVPQAKGSTQGFAMPVRNKFGRCVINPKTGFPRHRVVITSDNPKVKRWQKEVARAAQLALGGVTLALTGAIALEAVFYLPAPQLLPKDRGGLPIVKPDLDKLVRAIADALTGTFYDDDEQIVDLIARKRYSDTTTAARVEVTVTPLETTLPLFERSRLHDALTTRADVSGRRFGTAYP